MSGPQTFAHGAFGPNIVAALNLTGGVGVEVLATDVAYTATGCPFSSGNDGEYNANGAVAIPGIVIS